MRTLAITLLLAAACGQNSEIKNLRFKNGPLSDTNYLDQSADAFSSTTRRSATDCKKDGKDFLDADYWKANEVFYVCQQGEVKKIAENCDTASTEGEECTTTEEIRKVGLDIADLDALDKLEVIDQDKGLLGNLGGTPNDGQISNNPKAPVGACKAGQTKTEDINHGKAEYKCSGDLKWELSDLTCLSSNNQYKYKKVGSRCEREDVSQCSNGAKRARNLNTAKSKKRVLVSDGKQKRLSVIVTLVDTITTLKMIHVTEKASLSV